jgi:hypothetical protein
VASLEKDTHNIDGEVGSIGDVGRAVEVVAIIILLKGDLAIGNLGTLEKVQALGGYRLLESNAILAVKTRGLNLGVTLDCDVDGLVVDKIDVELLESIHILDVIVLADVDDLMLVGTGLREVERAKGNTRLNTLEVELAGEGVDGGVDGAVRLDGGVHLHGVRLAVGVEDVDALDFQLGLVELALRDLGHTDKDSAIRVESVRRCPPSHARGSGDITYIRGTTRATMQANAMR